MPGVCHRCKRNVYVADEKVALGRVWHNFCVSCRKCRKLLDECSAKLYQDEIYCRKCYGILCGRCEDDDEERRCGGRRGGCCRRCPTPARIPARAKPSPTAVTTWYSRGHSMQPCKACPRCSAKEPWFVCEGGSQRCPDGLGCDRRPRPCTRPSSCDESCPARESLGSVPSGSQEKICAPPKVVKETKPLPPCPCCTCCGRERPRRKSCCRRCVRPEKSDDERECRRRSRRSCDRSTCCAWKSRRRAASPCSIPDPPCLPCPPSDEERQICPRRRRSCDRSTCCAWRARRRAASPCSTADPPCLPCPPPRPKTPDPPCLPCAPCNPCPPCIPCPPRKPCSRPRTPEPPCRPCRTPEPPCRPCRTTEPPCRPCRTPEPPCTPCRTPEPPCRPCRTPEPPCRPCRTPEPPCRPRPCRTPEPPCRPRPCRTPDPPCRPCRTPEPPCRPCRTPEPPCRPCRTPEPPCIPCRTPEPPCRPCRTPEPPCRPCRTPEPPCRPCRTPEPPCRPCRDPEPPCRPCRDPEPPCRPCWVPEPPCRPCPVRCKTDGVEVLCPPAGGCRCSCCRGRRRGRSCSSSDRASKISSCLPCPAARPRCCRNDLPIGRPCRRCGRQVYHAELVLAAGTVFHTCCFTCRQCRKPLESTTVYEAQSEIFCKQCYVKRFGPNGYGYGLGAGTLQTP